MVFRWLQTTDNQGDLIISGGLVSGIDDIYININTAVNYILYASTTAQWHAKLSSQGGFQWAGFLPNEFPAVYGLAVDSDNNIFQMSQANQALSYLYGGFSFSPTTTVCNVRKINPSGAELWRVNIGYAAVVTCNSAIAVSQSTGDVYVAGSFTFGDTMQNGYNTPIGQLGFSGGGVFQWMVRIDDSQPVPSALSVSPNGNIVLVGSYYITAYPLGFYGVNGQSGRSVNPSQVLLSGFVATYSPGSALLYVATMDGASNDQAVDCAVDAVSNVFVAAQLSSSSVSVVDGLGNSQSISSSPSTVLKFSPSGKFLYSFRGTSGITVRDILRGKDNSMILAGTFGSASQLFDSSNINASKVNTLPTSSEFGFVSTASLVNYTTQVMFTLKSAEHSSRSGGSMTISDGQAGQMQPGTQSSTMTVYIIVNAIVCFLILVLVLLSMYCIRRRYIKARMRSSKMLLLRNTGGMTDQTLNAAIGSAIQIGGTAMGGTTFMNSSMEVAVPAYLELKRVAEILSFPTLHPFATSSTRLVAAKCFIGKVQKDSVHQEIALMWRFKDDDQIAKLVGFDTLHNVLLMINYELGSLEQLILGQALPFQQVDYSMEQQQILCLDVMTSLSILHFNSVVHNDIKSGNYLVQQGSNRVLRAVLTDFGICTIQSQANFVKGLQWNLLKGHSIKYAAPEVLQQLQVPEHLLPSSDVYAGAVVMFEILTRTKAWEGFNAAQVAELVLQGARPEAQFLESRAHMLFQVVQLAWAQDSSMRPSAIAIAGEVQKLSQS
ncbi:hypothetical protein MIR68_008796 [Amoeboaphelidium protococcarum]|nr:hypothetical protein MIR68_008796 [Amoeboaphelidium protococcarum]